ncbi:MAG: UDP-4-amino-4,6-dideoxy-N-acetyl-beta-L-altrosamine N-acetyltransferase [Calditerrivibrio sp.]|nr:UDP-4-amino-4,6-dideoxy-N-acetyl-beta-L-altrosamine N-acetyltransferase [Calditerrivibrio sp.]
MHKRFLDLFSFEGVSFVSFETIEDINKHIAILSLRNDERIRNYMFNDKIISLDEHLNFVEGLRDNYQKMYWAAYDGDLLVGSINLIDIDLKNRRTKLGIYTNPDLKGYGSKLMNTLKWLCFEKIGLNCLRLEVLANNSVAIEFYKKHNFVYEGKLREFILRKGMYIDVFIYSMLREEYERYQKGLHNS